jgi:hypothetical protein
MAAQKKREEEMKEREAKRKQEVIIIQTMNWQNLFFKRMCNYTTGFN